MLLYDGWLIVTKTIKRSNFQKVFFKLLRWISITHLIILQRKKKELKIIKKKCCFGGDGNEDGSDSTRVNMCIWKRKEKKLKINTYF